MDRPLKTEAIRNLLLAKTHVDLASMYNSDMEVQVLVDNHGGTEITGDYKGVHWRGYQDQNTGLIWKSFRIPNNPNKPEADYEDREMSFPLDKYTLAIGMTGWDWKNKLSRWVAFDFDAITGHASNHEKKLTQEQITELTKHLYAIEWCELRKSTGGYGLHLYVHIIPVPTITHDEHAALARAILSELSLIVGIDLMLKVDVCGANMWIYHKDKMKNSEGLKLIKKGTILTEIPPNWKNHLNVVKGKRKITIPDEIEQAGIVDLFEQMSSQRLRTILDETHKLIYNKAKELAPNCTSYNSDHNMIITHTIVLKQVHSDLKLKGPFDTIATGKDYGHDVNCFMYPIINGAFVVRRYTQGTAEAPMWHQDGQKWTKCFYNREPDFETACRANGGKQFTTDGYVFSNGTEASIAMNLLGINLEIPNENFYNKRQIKIKNIKGTSIQVEFEKLDGDNTDLLQQTWYEDRRKWKKMVDFKRNTPEETTLYNVDPVIRHLVSEAGGNYGWIVNCKGTWNEEPLHHVKPVLKSLGFTDKEVEALIGICVLTPWTIVNKPFQAPYSVLDRQWNRYAAQLKYQPIDNSEIPQFPTWQKILDHCGQGLNEVIKDNVWCRQNGILTGAHYLKCWVASLFQQPREPLPYLFFYGPQNSGKSIFHEALEELIANGVVRGDTALSNPSSFNGEIQFAVLCVLEETILKNKEVAYNRIKDWVTSRTIQLHIKGHTPYNIHNCTHWIQCANDHQACPIFPGDTRITMIHVPELSKEELIPKREMMHRLLKEAPHFLREVISLELPISNDRLNIPILATAQKEVAEEQNMNPVERFFKECCINQPGYYITYGELYTHFKDWLNDPNDAFIWTKQRFGKELPPEHPKGKVHGKVDIQIGNVIFKGKDEKERFEGMCQGRLVLHGAYLEVHIDGGTNQLEGGNLSPSIGVQVN